jgi:SMODS-associated and fused to various effectors sensor domain
VADAVEAQWHGHDYQARFFWLFAAALRDPEQSNVIEVTYEANGPKAFDDVVVRYNPGRHSLGARRVSVDYHQIKWHTTRAGRFGFADLIDPAFIGAEKYSILQRLKQAKATAPADSAFKLVTTDRVADDDPLASLISSKDHSLLLDVLFDATTDRSKMGKVRKLWREHLGLQSDEALRVVIDGLHIVEGHFALEDLRTAVNLRFRVVGLVPCNDTMEFKYDAAARALKVKGINRLTRETFETLCKEENWIQPEMGSQLRNVSLRSFALLPSDHLDAHPDATFSLVNFFDGRFLNPGYSWRGDLQPAILKFLRSQLTQTRGLRLFLDAHLSIAFLAGSILHLKANAEVRLVQKGRSGTREWNSTDDKLGPPLIERQVSLTGSTERVIAASITRNIDKDVELYVQQHLPNVKSIYFFAPQGGPNQAAIVGGAHAAQLASQVADKVASDRMLNATSHIFMAAPNSFAFYLGQHAEALGRCIPCVFHRSWTVIPGHRGQRREVGGGSRRFCWGVHDELRE